MSAPLPRSTREFVLHTDDDPILRAIAMPVASTELKVYRNLASEMVKYVRNPANGCIGLAAPQIGISKRVIAVGLPHSRDNWDDDRPYPYTAMINPRILEKSSSICTEEEGCLSLPKTRVDVARAKSIKVEFLDEQGRMRRLMLSDFAARVVQHEIDHLDGILMTDLVQNG